ncbi:MAG TPA: cytochrome c biogenesis protein ResB [Holophagaceae bacterium]|nr:cytochrome c biogenesis protein ResB [Holophagaceae bacterium]
MTDSLEPGTKQAAEAAARPFHLNLPLQAAALLGWCAAWMAAQSLLDHAGADPRRQILAFLAVSGALLVALSLRARRWAFQLFTSVPFAIAQLLFLAGAVAVGTFVPQELGPKDVQAHLGAAGGSDSAGFLLRHAHAGDLYHSLWFSGLLLLIAVSTLAVAWKKRPYPMHRVGFLLVHLAPTLILLGGLWGRFAGTRAFARLRVGEPAASFHVVAGADPAAWQETYDLPGFSVRLDRFHVDRYDPRLKLYAFVEPDGKGGFERDPKAYEARQGLEGRLPVAGARFKVDQVLPDAVDQGRWMENPAAPPNPALQVLLGLGDGRPIMGYLLPGDPGTSRFDEPGGRFGLVCRARFDTAEAAALKAPTREPGKLAMTYLGKTLEHEARPGTSWDFPVFSLKVVKAHRDFPFKAASKDIPPEIRGPWLELKLRTGDGQEAPIFLCARTPAFSDEANAKVLPPGMTLRYAMEGGEAPDRFALLTLEDQKVRLIEGGQVLRAEPITLNKPFVLAKGLSVTPMALLPHAEWVPDFRPNPEGGTSTPGRPALKITLTDPETGTSESRWLDAGAAAAGAPAGQVFLGGRVGLLFREQPAGPRDFRSVLVMQDAAGRELARKEVSINDPLVFRGHAFYQSNYDPRDPGVSGVTVVRDPGRPLTWLGFACLLLGTAWMFYLKPTLKRRAEGKGA